jgi:hypothetical protein
MTEPNDKEVERVQFIRPFSDWLDTQRESPNGVGLLGVELTHEFHDLVHAVTTMGKAGTLTLKLTVRPGEKGTTGSVNVTDEVIVKKPQSKVESFHFIDVDGNLTRNNPRQLGYDGPLLEVAERAANVKEV